LWWGHSPGRTHWTAQRAPAQKSQSAPREQTPLASPIYYHPWGEDITAGTYDSVPHTSGTTEEHLTCPAISSPHPEIRLREVQDRSLNEIDVWQV
jgi:hypothetical protein